MISPEYCLIMAKYNSWVNLNLYRHSGEISESECKKDSGLFFGSIFSTLNHIMYGDIALLGRLDAFSLEKPQLGVDLHNNFDDLYNARIKLDTDIETWVKGLTIDILSELITYKSNVDSKVRTLPKWLFIVHFFNHQTHHRGQITTALHQMGVDVGSIDLPAMPGVSPFG